MQGIPHLRMRRLNPSQAGSCGVIQLGRLPSAAAETWDVQPPSAPSRTAVATQRLRNGNDADATTARANTAPYENSPAYWRSRLKALAWSAAWSTQFEIGPVSQASIGNVGLHGKQTYVDLVVTPIGGFGWIVLEDFVDKNIIQMIERRSSGNFYIKIVSRTFLNPSRSTANLLRFKTPWHRDSGLR